MAALEPHYSNMIALKTAKWIIRRKKDFANPVKDAKLVVGFSPTRQFQVRRKDVTSTRPGCQDTFRVVAFRIAGTSEAETSVSGKALKVYLL